MPQKDGRNMEKEELEELAKAFYAEREKYRGLEKELEKKENEVWKKYSALTGKEHKKERKILGNEFHEINEKEIFPVIARINNLTSIYDRIQELLQHFYKD